MSSAVRPVLKVNRSNTASVLGRAYAVSKGLAADPARFSAPNPPLPELDAQIAKVEDSNKQARTHVFGAVKIRNLERDRLVGMLETECVYVKRLCDASPGEASVIIEAAGFSSASTRSYAKPLLSVSRGEASGTVVLDASVGGLMGGRSGKNKFFHWQWTSDGGKSFNDAPPTAVGKITLANLPPLTMVGFRVKVTTSASPGEWSPVVSLLVH